MSDVNTTYITQGKNDNGNISIRTAGNGKYIELAASQFSSNEINSIPEKTSFIKVSYDSGINFTTNNNIETNSKNLFIKTDKASLEGKNYKIEIFENSDIKIKSSNYNLSSTSDSSLKGIEDDINDYGHFRIRGFIGIDKKTIIVDDQETEIEIKNPKIQLETGENTKINIDSNSIKMQTKSGDSGRFLEINTESLSSFTIDNMKLSFDPITNNIKLQNSSNSYFEIKTDRINFESNMININNIANINKIIVNQDSIFNNSLVINKNLTSGEMLFVGNQKWDNRTESYTGGQIYLYKNNTDYLLISPEFLKQLFDWYNTKRWGIGCVGNTLYLRNVVGISSENLTPEGELVEKDGTTSYQWNFDTFGGYYKEKTSESEV